MAKHSFGAPVEDDILELQGVEYHLQPFGMKAFRDSMKRAQEAEKLREMEGAEKAEATYDLSVDLIVNSVIPEEQDRMRAQIERSVPPMLVSQVAAAIMRGLSDLDPTLPPEFSDGSSETGQDSTDGASAEESTPST